MEKAEIQYKTDLLLANILFSDLDRKQYIDWSIDLLQAGIETPDMYILASLDIDDWYAIEHYFVLTTELLGLDISKSQRELLEIFILDISSQVFSGIISPEKALYKIEYIRTMRIDHDGDFTFSFSDHYPNFTYLVDDAASLEYDGQPYFYSGLTLKDLDETIIEEFRLIQLHNMNGIDSLNIIYCSKCKNLSNAISIKTGFLIKKDVWKCKKCQSNDILSWSDVSNRKTILKKLYSSISKKTRDYIIFMLKPSEFEIEDSFVAHIPKVNGVEHLFDALSENLRFPDYFGRNWDAVNDCLNDLMWIDKKNIVILHDSSINLEEEDFNIYVDILHNTILSWLSDTEHTLRVVFRIDYKERIESFIEK